MTVMYHICDIVYCMSLLCLCYYTYYSELLSTYHAWHKTLYCVIAILNYSSLEMSVPVCGHLVYVNTSWVCLCGMWQDSVGYTKAHMCISHNSHMSGSLCFPLIMLFIFVRICGIVRPCNAAFSMAFASESLSGISFARRYCLKWSLKALFSVWLHLRLGACLLRTGFPATNESMTVTKISGALTL